MMKKFLLVCSFGLICGCVSMPVTKTTPGTPLEQLCKRYNIQWQFDNVTQVILLDYKNQKAKAMVGSPIVLLGNQKITLNHPVRRENSTIFVPDDFESKVISPFGVSRSVLGKAVESENLKIRTIVIDAGHGGKDPGARGHGGVKEKEVVLDISKRVKELLQDAGIKVIMTRVADTYPTLEERTELASHKDIDLYVSIHANSMPSRKTQGVEIYYVKTSSKRDLDEETRRKNEREFVKSLSTSYSKYVPNIVADMMYQLKVAESGKLAMRLARDMSSDLGTPNRGARHCRYFVVRNTVQPSVLVETGFLTNRQEERKLNTSIYRQKVAESIVKSILTYAST